MMRRSGFGWQLWPTANARSGLVYVLHRAEKKLGGFFGSYSSTASALDAQSINVSPSCVVCL